MRPTCVDCSIKHLSQASILLQESRHGYPDHIYYARGHMAEAEAELAKLYPVHSDLVRTERKQLEENPEYSPDFQALMTKIDEECEVCSLAGNPRSVTPISAKQLKVDEINEALSKSEVAVEQKARAEILPDGRIEYSVETTTRSGRPYRIKSSFNDMMFLIWGEEARRLKEKYGRGRRKSNPSCNSKVLACVKSGRSLADCQATISCSGG